MYPKQQNTSTANPVNTLNESDNKDEERKNLEKASLNAIITESCEIEGLAKATIACTFYFLNVCFSPSLSGENDDQNILSNVKNLCICIIIIIIPVDQVCGIFGFMGLQNGGILLDANYNLGDKNIYNPYYKKRDWNTIFFFVYHLLISSPIIYLCISLGEFLPLV